MLEPSYWLYALILACEIGFWVVLLSALAVRYLARKASLSRALLLCLPLIDLLLLLFAAADLRGGATATFAHGLAAAYIGFTVAFGGMAVTWADAEFAYRFAQGPVPAKAPSRGLALVLHELKLWGRCVVACLITMFLVEALVAYIDRGDTLQALLDWQRHALGCIVLWFLFGPVWSLATAWRRPA